ncbi:MAG: Ppx/GppA family phosphatase [Acidobacteria bacterium]|nr:Ppx/GppA family phosphatase [Acidobacteriota bacterium]TDI51400.1 MAG: Ppx/GppA family phosphatase [Acidobacteriota bacterium]TDI53072.1 MAG: Ppx/GppA family phosphatase [Acidobacteriota bacterium]TDI54426.1 MAG: Ppx/GppA family phosphatase [Acidobacteriota bacterium]
MRVGVVDIGTNSMRLLVTDGTTELGRWVQVTGLGRGVDASGSLSEGAIEATLTVFRRFGDLMAEMEVERRMAIATSASRDASNREPFFDRAEQALGMRPTLISGHQEARFAYEGATAIQELDQPVVVSDIGGGSSEFVSAADEVSIDIGSVRLTERILPGRPASPGEMDRARSLVDDMFGEVEVGTVGTLVGVAGTWTSIGAIAQELPEYDRELVHGYSLSRSRLSQVTSMLSPMTTEETAAIPSLDPRRAPVILAGTVLAGGVMDALDVAEVVVSEQDTLDGAAAHLLALP